MKCKWCLESNYVSNSNYLCLNHTIFKSKVLRLICGEELFKLIYTEEFQKLSNIKY